MKKKLHRQVQPYRTVLYDAQVRREINNFLQALDSYPDRVAKEPNVTFQQHLCSIFAGRDDRRRNRPSRH